MLCMKVVFEFVEIFLAIGYLLFSWRKEQRLTRGLLLASILMLLTDIFILHGDRPGWAWLLMNIPAMVIVYEKVTRKMLLVVAKKVAAVVTMLLH
jgi:hypothetical protein